MATDFIEFEGQEMAYSVFGSGPRVIVLTHGILLNKEMFTPLAEALAERGNRVVTLDMFGHGRSDPGPQKVSIPFYASAVVHAMKELDINEAVVGGTSLGANVTLEIAAHHPERLRAIVVEMPALENAILGGAAFFTPVLAGAVLARPFAQIGSKLLRLVPRGIAPYQVEILIDVMRRDPRATAGVIKGVFFGPLAPSAEARKQIEMPTLVLGHRFDPIHPFSDAKRLAEELSDARFVEARSPFELRITPKRLTEEIANFLDEVWRPRAVRSEPSGRAGTPRGARSKSR